MNSDHNLVRNVPAFLLLAASLLSGCGANSEQAGVPSSTDSALTAVGAEDITGNYVDLGYDEFPYYAIEFNANGTFSARGGCKTEATELEASKVDATELEASNFEPRLAACHAIYRVWGTWTTSVGPFVRGEAPQSVVLTDSFNQVTRLYYNIDGTKLDLKSQLFGQPSVFVKQ